MQNARDGDGGMLLDYLLLEIPFAYGYESIYDWDRTCVRTERDGEFDFGRNEAF